MNERIKELAEQANAWYPMGYPSGEGGDAAWKNLVIFEKEDLEKFAELIVQECADIALKSGSVTNKSAVAIAEADRIYHKINEHFGVKE